MSHFTVGIIVPQSVEDVEAEIDRLLAPYSEHLEVPAYDAKCYCVGRIANSYGEDEAIRQHGTWADKREAFRAELQRRNLNWDSEGTDALWEEFTKDFKHQYRKTMFETARTHPLYQKPNPKCSKCHGTGFYKTTYNPDSKWDWYRIGGRWDGDLIESPRRSDNGFNWDTDHQQLQNNSVPLEELLQRETLFTFFALVTPDGQWHEKGRMGWFAMVSDEMPEEGWETVSLNLYKKYREGHDIILVDAHI